MTEHKHLDHETVEYLVELHSEDLESKLGITPISPMSVKIFSYEHPPLLLTYVHPQVTSH